MIRAIRSASPLYGRLAGLPPIQLHVGTSEVLLDDSRRYVERARREGVDATAHIWEGMPHVFPASVGTLEAAERALDTIAAFLKEKLGSHVVGELGRTGHGQPGLAHAAGAGQRQQRDGLIQQQGASSGELRLPPDEPSAGDLE